MHSVFEVDDFSDPYWQPPAPGPAMNRSESEWALEKFLEEVTASASSSASASASDNTAAPSVASSKRDNGVDDDVVEIKKAQITPHPQPSDPTPAAPIDSEEYRAFLKSELDRACAAVAMSRASTVKPEDFPSLAKDQTLNTANNFQMGSQAFRTGHGIPMAQNEADSGLISIPALPTIQRRQEVQARQTTSGSSREDSDDDEVEGDTETNENMDPADAKRARRMQSNRESARRSRRRKQAQLNELETQVGQLRDERTSLLSRFTNVNQQCDDAAVDNRILKADIETLRAKVKMAEEQVKRVTGWNPMLLARCNMPSIGMQFVGGQADASTNVAVPMQPNSNQFFHLPIPSVASAASHLQRLNDSFSNNTLIPLAANPQPDNTTGNIGGMTSMQLTASGPGMADMPSMQHMQKQIGPAVGPGGALPVCDSGLPAKDNKKK